MEVPFHKRFCVFLVSFVAAFTANVGEFLAGWRAVNVEWLAFWKGNLGRELKALVDSVGMIECMHIQRCLVGIARVDNLVACKRGAAGESSGATKKIKDIDGLDVFTGRGYGELKLLHNVFRGEWDASREC